MARLNTRTSATPFTGRASTVDSLYRDPTPLSRGRSHAANTARTTTYSVMSPSQSNSDKENEAPPSRENTPGLGAKGRRQMTQPTQPPTPPSDAYSEHRSKRRRTDEHDFANEVPVFEDGAADGYEDNEVEAEDVAPDDEEDESTRYYDPQQVCNAFICSQPLLGTISSTRRTSPSIFNTINLFLTASSSPTLGRS
jgi:non-structural maintenance of chromosomes element 4